MASQNYPMASLAARYAREVLRGVVPACEYVRQACQRHLDDMERSRDKNYPYVWDKAAAEKVCRFASNMVHVKGREWAGKKITLQPWQCFILACAFGWVRKSDGLRRYREIYAEIPRKSGKSILGACIGLYMFSADGEPGAEVYSGATSEKQAWEVFGPARQMCLKNPAFAAHFGIHVGAKNLHILQNASKFEPIIGKPGDGASPHCAIVDEYHEHPTPDLYDTMLTGMGARSQPMLVVITTAGVDTSAPCFAKRDESVKVLQGTLENDQLFTIIFTIDEADDWTMWTAWEKANPNLGISLYADFLEARRKEAIQIASRQNIIKCKHLNVWANAGSAWINMVAWNACRADVMLDDFAGESCWVGVDLASKIDLTAMMLLFRRGNECYLFGRYYLPEETVQLPENTHYQRWVAEGLLVATPGARTDYRYLMDDLLAFAEQFSVRELAYDPREAEMLMQEIREQVAFPCIEINQSPVCISEPMKEFEALYLSGKLHHDGDPVLNWQASNVVLRSTKTKAYYPSKERPENKIDGIVAAIMALSRAMLHMDQPFVGLEEWE
ncbi:phage Terminase [Nitratidesulfovibrio vulgaris DP4]|uniref:Phage Terminase n=2 Tax=Nitratidesulfovibrio vulgaris TaxID=881 RepID=A0A0H3A6I0_NITV4|nr:phage Terminase [Nitratidesulfovibrio vulgaris DP4]